MKVTKLQAFLLLMIASRGQALPMVLLVIASMIGFAVQGVAFALIAAPFVLLTSLAIFAAVTFYRRAPLAVIAGVVIVMAAAIAIAFQHGLAGLLHDAIAHPPTDSLKWFGIGVGFTILGAMKYRKFDNESRTIRAHIAYFGTVMTFWVALLGTSVTLVQWHQHLHGVPHHAVHARQTLPTVSSARS
jgi:hypothetical protein